MLVGGTGLGLGVELAGVCRGVVPLGHRPGGSRDGVPPGRSARSVLVVVVLVAVVVGLAWVKVKSGRLEVRGGKELPLPGESWCGGWCPVKGAARPFGTRQPRPGP